MAWHLALKGGNPTELQRPALASPADPASVRHALATIASGPEPDPIALAGMMPDADLDKYDRYLGRELRTLVQASRSLDTGGLGLLAAELADAGHEPVSVGGGSPCS